MIIVLAVVLAVMVIMNGVMFYVLRMAVIVTGKQVDACFVRELEAYDGFLDQKGRENQQLEEEKKGLQKEITDMQGVMVSLKTSPFYAPRPVPRDLFVPSARYIDNDFFDNHKLVSDRMRGLDKGVIMRRIREKNPYAGDLERYRAACRILEVLQLDALYELATMEGSAQLKVLRESLEGEDRKLLEEYADVPEDGSFDGLRFVSWLREVRTAHDPGMYVRTGERRDDFSAYGQDVVTQYDGNISEGMKFIHQNKLFDFSIYRLRSKK